MNSALFTAPMIIGSIAFVCLLLVVLRIAFASRKHFEQLSTQNRKLGRELDKTSKQLLEVRSVVVGLGQRVTEQQDIIQHLHERVLELEQADTDGRLYTRATKMVQLGAELDELIHECELPKAEAELMMSLQKKLAGQESVPPLESLPEQRLRQGQRKLKRK
ncbi:DUF2802 domain-containing protein [Vibrio sp. WXL103]|uniref:DUF2802 domain-containing protein n=1 Tax=unclassified Vibrio TaxID=2614977 RepID=UPI003EC6253F